MSSELRGLITGQNLHGLLMMTVGNVLFKKSLQFFSVTLGILCHNVYTCHVNENSYLLWRVSKTIFPYYRFCEACDETRVHFGCTLSV